MAELEKAGVPTVAFVVQTFEEDWRTSAKVFGLKALPYVLVPRPFVGLAAEDIRPHVDAAFEKLVEKLTQSAPEAAEEEPVRSADVIAVEGVDPYDAFERMNRMFLGEGWGDGFPLWAPTRERVDAMLRGTRRAADQVVAVLAPERAWRRWRRSP